MRVTHLTVYNTRKMGPFRKDDMSSEISPHIIPIPSTSERNKSSFLKEQPTEQAKLLHEVPPAPIFTASLAFKTQTAFTSYKPHLQTILHFYPPTSTCPALTFTKSIKYQGTPTFNGCCPSRIR